MPNAAWLVLGCEGPPRPQRAGTRYDERKQRTIWFLGDETNTSPDVSPGVPPAGQWISVPP